MAIGDGTAFDQSIKDRGDAVYDFSVDTFKLALITGTLTPTAADADPRWGAGGTTDLSANEVTPGGNYVAGGNALTTLTYNQTSGVARFDSDAFSVLNNASNPSTARWAIIYDDTATGKQALFFVDLGSVIDLSVNDLTITPDVTDGWFKTNQV